MNARTFRASCAFATLISAVALAGCGTSSPDSKMQAATGVSTSGYPVGESKDPGSPALASSSESKYSRDQTEEGEKGEKKVSVPANKGAETSQGSETSR